MNKKPGYFAKLYIWQTALKSATPIYANYKYAFTSMFALSLYYCFVGGKVYICMCKYMCILCTLSKNALTLYTGPSKNNMPKGEGLATASSLFVRCVCPCVNAFNLVDFPPDIRNCVVGAQRDVERERESFVYLREGERELKY